MIQFIFLIVIVGGAAVAIVELRRYVRNPARSTRMERFMYGYRSRTGFWVLVGLIALLVVGAIGAVVVGSGDKTANTAPTVSTTKAASDVQQFITWCWLHTHPENPATTAGKQLQMAQLDTAYRDQRRQMAEHGFTEGNFVPDGIADTSHRFDEALVSDPFAPESQALATTIDDWATVHCPRSPSTGSVPAGNTVPLAH